MAISRAALARNICFGLYFFLLGVEYAVILPTINGYLITLQADNTFLGVVLASFSFAGLLTAPLYGYITDRTGSAKACVIVGNLLEVAGNFMYFVGKSKFFVLAGRVIAGLGSGAGSSVLGTVAKSTTEKERTSSFALLMALRQIGLVIGPGLNAFLYALNFRLGPFMVDRFTSPGLFMAMLWLLHTLLFLIIYSDAQQNSETSSNTVVNESVSGVNMPTADNSSPVVITKGYMKEFLREEVIVVLACGFLSMFIQTGMEAAVTPMTLMYFDWHGLTNSYLLLGVGALVIISFMTLHVASKYFMDRALLLFGCISLGLSYAIYLAASIVLYFSDNTLETPPWVLPVFSVYIFVWVVAAAYFFVPQISLFSKITSSKTQAFNQGVRMIAIRIGMILGPLWASPMVSYARLPILAGVNLFILCLLASMIIASYKRLLPPPTPESSISEQSEPTESSPLLDEA